ncbi:hypothetical protein HY024_03055 [Candidatus Curtissbacteria bacterium]|nr:hypothetical protein [Candidatus Curtissbacteria bacterium]
MEKVKEVILVSFISLVSTLIAGYNFAISDQQIFIPYILKFQDPSLFKEDSLFSQFSANASLFYQTFAFLTKYTDIQLIFFACFTIAKAILFIGIYYLSKSIFKNRNIALLSLLPFIIPKFIGGTATLTFDSFFGYRSIGQIFLVFYLLFIIKKRFVFSSLTGALCLFIHPLSIIPSLPLLPILIFKNSKNKIKDLLIFTVFTVTFVFFYQLTFKTDQNLFVHSPKWLSIIRARDNYIFMSQWQLLGWLSLCMYIVLIGIYTKFSKVHKKSDIVLISLISLFMATVASLGLDFFQLPGLAKFQLVRAVIPIGIFGLIVSPSLLMFKNKTNRFFGFISFVTLSLNLFYVFLISTVILIILASREKGTFTQIVPDKLVSLWVVTIAFGFFLNTFYFRNAIQFPLQPNDWTSVQIWSKNNTPKESIFIVPPTLAGFRIFSSRTIVGDVKDGAVVLYSEGYAEHWDRLMKELAYFDKMNEVDFKTFSKMQRYDYIVTPKPQKLNFPVIYQNNSYTVYKI